MARGAVLQVRVDQNVREDADALFSTLGLDTATAVRMFLARAVATSSIPFMVAAETPNATTRRAIEDADAGRGMSHPYDSAKELMRDALSDADVA